MVATMAPLTLKALRGLAIEERRRILSLPESIAALGSKTVNLERKRLAREAAHVHRITCSRPWADEVLNHKTPYPPGGRETLMVMCRGCERLVPPMGVGGTTSSQHCGDCAAASYAARGLDLPPSPGTVIDRGLYRRLCRRPPPA